MSWKKNQMFWLVLSVSLLCLLLFLAYESFVMVHPIPTSALRQTPYSKKPETKTTKARTYFQRFPERYIRIVDESWRHDPAAHIARHTLTLENIAAVAYRDIEIRFRYESTAGKVVHTWIETLPGPLAAGQKMEVKSLEVRDIPPSTASVVTAIAGAQVVQ